MCIRDSDHCESAIEFTADRWLGLREQSQARAPELVRMIDGHLITPESYERALAAMKRMLDEGRQPRVEARDPGQRRPGELARRQLAAPEQPRLLARRAEQHRIERGRGHDEDDPKDR